MRSKIQFVGLAGPIILLSLAYGMDSALSSLRQYAGATFDFRNAIWGQFGLVLFFGFMLVGLQTMLVHIKPARWLLWVYVGLGCFVLFPFVAVFLLSLDFILLVPNSLRQPLTAAPFSFAGIGAVVLIWTGASHMFRRDLS
ncbi:MAG: hypothetical protein KIS85_08675 [Anaerolineales bacterium]|nr:hypothetical protein [Anaerolineales bacterium]